MLDFDKYEYYNLPHVTTCPGLPCNAAYPGRDKLYKVNFNYILPIATL